MLDVKRQALPMAALHLAGLLQFLQPVAKPATLERRCARETHDEEGDEGGDRGTPPIEVLAEGSGPRCATGGLLVTTSCAVQ